MPSRRKGALDPEDHRPHALCPSRNALHTPPKSDRAPGAVVSAGSDKRTSVPPFWDVRSAPPAGGDMGSTGGKMNDRDAFGGHQPEGKAAESRGFGQTFASDDRRTGIKERQDSFWGPEDYGRREVKLIAEFGDGRDVDKLVAVPPAMWTRVRTS
ncbi:hypothetical protein CMUS01_04872 [Colletotrichum musicola]|uniref:Uncharacterized protein n=1 Tax=Colletotrichum musicola TaxID=2175873 RepID=A0A8H6KUE2_9PEZI|nr:hypothetical protein CMUS01_04872 [Colletotrichum musicola]